MVLIDVGPINLTIQCEVFLHGDVYEDDDA